MAKKTKATKKSARRVQAKLPAGFTAVNVSGGFGAWHDFTKNPICAGKVVSVDSYMAEDDEGKKKKRGVLRIDTGSGVVESVGESAGLRGLFEQKGLKGRTVHIQFLGQRAYKDKKGRTRKFNEFAVGMK